MFTKSWPWLYHTNIILFFIYWHYGVLIIILRKNMKKIILKYLKSNSKKLVLIVSGFHFLGPRFGGPPKSNGGRKTFERQINKYKNWKETVCAGEPVCIHRSWVESAYAILGRSEVLFPRCVRWSFVERSKPISLFLSQSSLPVLLLILVNGRWFVLSHSHFLLCKLMQFCFIFGDLH